MFVHTATVAEIPVCHSLQVFVLPYFNVFFSDTLHFTKEQIGALSALRPWLSAACQVMLCSMADWMGAHTAVLVLTFTVSVLLRCLLMAMPPHFIAVAGRHETVAASVVCWRVWPELELQYTALLPWPFQ